MEYAHQGFAAQSSSLDRSLPAALWPCSRPTAFGGAVRKRPAPSLLNPHLPAPLFPRQLSLSLPWSDSSGVSAPQPCLMKRAVPAGAVITEEVMEDNIEHLKTMLIE
ncbi:hypothetical protein AOLI_G00209220 [Acnodon oligacanthus]